MAALPDKAIAGQELLSQGADLHLKPAASGKAVTAI
jgi:hypothetical protein